MKFQSFRPRINRSRLLGFITVLTISLLWGSQIALAQVDDASQPMVQELSGLLGKNTIAVYRLLDLKEGQQLYARMENSFGNLDPFLMLFPGDTNPQDITSKLITEVDQVIAEGGDPLETLPAIFDDVALIWRLYCCI